MTTNYDGKKVRNDLRKDGESWVKIVTNYDMEYLRRIARQIANELDMYFFIQVAKRNGYWICVVDMLYKNYGIFPRLKDGMIVGTNDPRFHP